MTRSQNASSLIFFEINLRIFVAPKNGSEKRHRNEALDRTKTEANIDSWTQRGGNHLVHLPRKTPDNSKGIEASGLGQVQGGAEEEVLGGSRVQPECLGSAQS